MGNCFLHAQWLRLWREFSKSRSIKGNGMKRIAILGASGHGKVVAEVAELTGWGEVVFFDDAYPAVKTIGEWSVQGTVEDLVADAGQFQAAIIAIGDNQIRLEKSKYVLLEGVKLGTLVHPSSIVSKFAEIDAGTVVMAGAVINPFVSVGLGSIINTSCSIDHDCILSEGVHVSPGAHVAGGVSVGEMSWLGIGSIVKQGVEIGASVIVAAGAVVINDVPRNSMVKGIPAK